MKATEDSGKIEIILKIINPCEDAILIDFKTQHLEEFLQNEHLKSENIENNEMKNDTRKMVLPKQTFVLAKGKKSNDIPDEILDKNNPFVFARNDNSIQVKLISEKFISVKL